MSDTLKYCALVLRQRGADKFQCALTERTHLELNLEQDELALMRTTVDTTLSITLIKNNQKGDISLNKTEHAAIDEAINTAFELAASSMADPDYDISPYQEPAEFAKGPKDPDTERMYALLKGYSEQVPKAFPLVKLAESVFAHDLTVQRFVNSSGVDFVTHKGIYSMSSVFSSKDGMKTSSFNYTGFSLRELEKDLLECSSLKTLLTQSVEHLDARTLQGKFVGDVVITPDCLGGLLAYYSMCYLGDRALISGTSILKDRLGQTVASPKLTFWTKPVSEEIADGYFVTPDGFAAQDVAVIEDGVLKSFMLSLYGANKTKRERAKNAGGCYVVMPGEKTLDEVIAGVEKGLLVARYSGGNPSANGDFSGVAKNSYYIENGKILYPVSETMISGNLAELFLNIKEISRERVDFGSAILPYIHATGITISGK